MQGSRIVVEAMLKEGVDTLFCYTGGAVISIFDALYKYGKKINCIRPRHEQAGVHAADGYARVTGKPGVVLVTSGPGATNTVTGIATAYMDSVPLVVITGQVASAKIGSDAFQESDITGIVTPITKGAFLVRSIEELAQTIKNAFYLATTGRPGPVLIDIPVDIQNSEIDFFYPKHPNLPGYNPTVTGHPRQVRTAFKLLEQSKTPVIISGGGVMRSDAGKKMNEFSQKYGIPVVTTLMGHGILPERRELFLGGVGMHGSLCGNYALQNADLIIAMGTRFSDRVICKAETFAPKAKIIHVDIDPAEIGKNVSVDVPIVGDAKSVLEEFLQFDKKFERNPDYSVWVKELNEYKNNVSMEYPQNGTVQPHYIIQLLDKHFPPETIVATDVGQNQMWTAQHFSFSVPRTLLTSGGLGTMGYGLPAAMGAAVAYPDRQILMIAGDGGFQMNIQELATLVNYNLKVKMVVLDNSYLGMVRQWQELLYEKRYAGTVMDHNPDFVQVAKAMGVKGVQLNSREQANDVIEELVKTDSSMLVHVKIDREANALPMVPVGKSLDQAVIKI